MLSVHGIRLSYGVHTLIDNLSFDLSPGDHMGLVGPNGCGKTTLLRVLAGQSRPERGRVARPKTQRLGYLAQGWNPEPGLSLGDILERAAAPPEDLTAELEQLSIDLAAGTDDAAAQERYDEIIEALAHPLPPDRLPGLLARLDLDGLEHDQPAATLSGGEKTRLALAILLLSEPEILLLDEPTNHLDISALEWLEEWLAGFSGAVLIASHDRTFLDRTCNRILAIDPAKSAGTVYAGNYSAYMDTLDTMRRKQWEAWRDQEDEIRRVKRDINRTKEQARHVEITTKPNQPGIRRYAKKVAKKAKSREKKLDRYLGSDERVEKPGRSWNVKVDWGPGTHLGKSVLTLDRLTIGYPGLPALVESIDLQVEPGARVAIVGPNGSGKTSLLRTIGGELNPLAGQCRRGVSVVPGYLAQEQETLDPTKSAFELIQEIVPQSETDARNALHHFLFAGDSALRPAGQLSYRRTRPPGPGALGHQGLQPALARRADKPPGHPFARAIRTGAGRLRWLCVGGQPRSLLRAAFCYGAVDLGGRRVEQEARRRGGILRMRRLFSAMRSSESAWSGLGKAG